MSFDVAEQHFLRAAREIGKSGENDTLPYDPDARFVKESADGIAKLCKSLFEHIENLPSDDAAKGYLNSLDIFSERLLTPAGAHGFRIITKIHPFWSVYLNGIGVAVAEQVERLRSSRVFSYRLSSEEDRLFDPSYSWRFYKQTTVDQIPADTDKVVIQTDKPCREQENCCGAPTTAFRRSSTASALRCGQADHSKSFDEPHQHDQ